MKKILTNTYLWAVVLFVIALSTPGKQSGGGLALVSLLLLVISVIRSLRDKRKRRSAKSQSNTKTVSAALTDKRTEPETHANAYAGAITRDAANDTDANNVVDIERFKKISPESFARVARKKGYVAFDFETTGLGRVRDKICEVGAIKYNERGQEVARFETLVNPKRNIPLEVTQKNGISNTMVEDAPDITKVIPDFLRFIGDLPIIAYNADFDISFLKTAVNSANVNCAITYADALAWARKKYTLSSYKLVDVATHIGVNTLGAHRAIRDCEIMNVVIQNMMNREE